MENADPKVLRERRQAFWSTLRARFLAPHTMTPGIQRHMSYFFWDTKSIESRSAHHAASQRMTETGRSRMSGSGQVQSFVSPTAPTLIGVLAQSSGFDVETLRSYGLVEALSSGLTMSWGELRADAVAQCGTIMYAAEALKAEGRTRAERRDFFGYMAYASRIAQAVTKAQ